MAAGYFPSVVFGAETTTSAGIQFSFINAAAPLSIPAIATLALTFSLVRHSVAPALLALLIPLFLLKTIWLFRYVGPAVERRTTLFGIALWRRTYPLQQGDSASIDPIEDSFLLTQRPRWYRLTLWSSALGKDHEVMRSNQPDDLERTTKLLNDAIARVRGRSSAEAPSNNRWRGP